MGDEFSIKVAFGEVRGIPVSMGNPHFTVFMHDFVPGWQGEAAEIGKHHDFKYGINVEFVKVATRRIWMCGSTSAEWVRPSHRVRDHALPRFVIFAKRANHLCECMHRVERKLCDGKTGFSSWSRATDLPGGIVQLAHAAHRKTFAGQAATAPAGRSCRNHRAREFVQPRAL